MKTPLFEGNAASISEIPQTDFLGPQTSFNSKFSVHVSKFSAPIMLYCKSKNNSKKDFSQRNSVLFIFLEISNNIHLI